MRDTWQNHVLLRFILITGMLWCCSSEAGIVYRNPRIYNVRYSFELLRNSGDSLFISASAWV